MNKINKKNLLENHLHFLSTHRGVRESLGQAELIHSDKSFFNIGFALSAKGIEAISLRFNLYLPEWIKLADNKIKERKLSEGITYMTFLVSDQIWNLNATTVVRKASTLQQMEDFSWVQAKGFCETKEEFNEWYPWLREKNMKNFKDNNQNFYVAYKKEKPVGVCLSIIHRNIAGIYAVTTVAEYRRQGISATIMKSIITDCAKNNIPVITLQVNTHSYAHSFYKKLGFKDEFRCKIGEPSTKV